MKRQARLNAPPTSMLTLWAIKEKINERKNRKKIKI